MYALLYGNHVQTFDTEGRFVPEKFEEVSHDRDVPETLCRGCFSILRPAVRLGLWTKQ